MKHTSRRVGVRVSAARLARSSEKIGAKIMEAAGEAEATVGKFALPLAR